MNKMLRQSRTSRKTVLDSMMETMEEYTRHLEEQIAERSAEVALAKEQLQAVLAQSVPPHIASRLVNGETIKLTATAWNGVQGRVYPHLGVVAMEVTGLPELLMHGGEEGAEVGDGGGGAREVLRLLGELCAGVDNVVRKYSAFR